MHNECEQNLIAKVLVHATMELSVVVVRMSNCYLVCASPYCVPIPTLGSKCTTDFIS